MQALIRLADVDDDEVVNADPSTRISSSIAPASCPFGRSNSSEPARISKPDLCLATSSRKNSLIETGQVLDRVEHREPRAHAEKERDLSQTDGLRSTTIVDRFDSRASSTAQFTATVVVPAPPLAPREGEHRGRRLVASSALAAGRRRAGALHESPLCITPSPDSSSSCRTTT